MSKKDDTLCDLYELGLRAACQRDTELHAFAQGMIEMAQATADARFAKASKKAYEEGIEAGERQWITASLSEEMAEFEEAPPIPPTPRRPYAVAEAPPPPTSSATPTSMPTPPSIETSAEATPAPTSSSDERSDAERAIAEAAYASHRLLRKRQDMPPKPSKKKPSKKNPGRARRRNPRMEILIPGDY